MRYRVVPLSLLTCLTLVTSVAGCSGGGEDAAQAAYDACHRDGATIDLLHAEGSEVSVRLDGDNARALAAMEAADSLEGDGLGVSLAMLSTVSCLVEATGYPGTPEQLETGDEWDGWSFVETSGAGSASTATFTASGSASAKAVAAPDSPPPSSDAPTEQPAVEATSLDAAALAERMRALVPEIAGVSVYTTESDPNDLLGRPSGYTSAAMLVDPRSTRSDGDAVGVDQGAVIEVFASAADARARADYIAAVTAGLAPLTEWDHVAGGALLRVSGALDPEVDDAYAAAWSAAQQG